VVISTLDSNRVRSCQVPGAFVLSNKKKRKEEVDFLFHHHGQVEERRVLRPSSFFLF